MAVGVDGCPAGWIALIGRDLGLEFLVFATIRDMLSHFAMETIAIDIPIGLTDAGPRTIDVLTRRMLSARRSSVFPSPIRPVLNAANREQASRVGRATDGRGVGCQSWAIVPKIRQLDSYLQQYPEHLPHVHEVHPELSWMGMNAGVPLQHPKKNADGRAERLQLVSHWFGPPGVEAFHRAATRFRRAEVQLDDLLDAFSCLWTANRIDTNSAVGLLGQPQRDSANIPIQMVY